AVRGDLEQARRLYQQSLEIVEALGDRQGKAATLAMMGQILAAQGQHEAALRAYLESLSILVQMQAADAAKVAKIIADFKAQVGEAAFRALWRKVTGSDELPEWL
ncbi:MAG: tetratricopeptide repeat protein, partial [Anaerolineae bacterium]|nr:tetratricopeptide repeat protein [Anaerolineae bacterium]